MNSDLDPSSGETAVPRKFGRRDWDDVRLAFSSSIMRDTPLASLAQNLDMRDWPIGGPDETPTKYLEYPFEELIQAPGLRHHPERVDQLISILKETLAFDEPFGAMVSEQEETQDRDNPVLKNLAKLGIPEDFPMPLVALTAETRQFCMTQQLATLREFALFTQSMAQNVVVAGDFRALLNALSYIDEQVLSLYLPFRAGAKGLHLLEGIALTARAFPDEVQAALARDFGARLGADDAEKASRSGALETAAAAKILGEQAAAYVEYFQDDLARLQADVDAGVPLGRLAAVLKDPVVESIATSLLRPYLRFPEAKATVRATKPPMDEPAQSTGFWSKLTRLFRR